jgi:hypothetical protein
MRLLALLTALSLAAPAQATQWFCQSGLEPAPTPQSALAFRLMLNDTGTFQAEGQRAGRGFGWDGQYTVFDDRIALIGDLEAQGTAFEARALSEHMQEDVLILSLQEHAEAPHMVRCLRHDLR